jgi:hypothetical protein
LLFRSGEAPKKTVLTGGSLAYAAGDAGPKATKCALIAPAKKERRAEFAVYKRELKTEVRLAGGDPETLGIYLFGPRWQCPLARAIGRSDRLVRYWKGGRRPVSIAASRQIEELVRAKHDEQMRRTRAYYLNMVAGLSNTGIKARLLSMDLFELRLDNQLRQASLTAPRDSRPAGWGAD